MRAVPAAANAYVNLLPNRVPATFNNKRIADRMCLKGRFRHAITIDTSSGDLSAAAAWVRARRHTPTYCD